MTKIEVFNDSAMWIEKIASDNEEYVAIVVDAMISALIDNGIDVEEYL